MHAYALFTFISGEKITEIDQGTTVSQYQLYELSHYMFKMSTVGRHIYMQ